MVRSTHPISISHADLSGIDSPAKKPLVLIWTNQALFEDFHIQIFNWKKNIQIPIFRIDVPTRLLPTQHSYVKWYASHFYFPPKTFTYWLRNKKAFGLDLDKQSTFWRLSHTDFNWKRKRSNSKLQDRCAYPTTTNIALLCKMVRIPFLFPTRKNLSGIDCPTNAFGRDLDKKITFGMFSHKDF